MNISQHCFLPTVFKPGQCNFDGSYRGNELTALTCWFPISTLGRILFYTVPDAEVVFGYTYGRYFDMPNSSSSDTLLQYDVLTHDYCIFDGSGPLSSIPFTYILF